MMVVDDDEMVKCGDGEMTNWEVISFRTVRRRNGLTNVVRYQR